MNRKKPSEKILSMLIYWEKVSVGYKIEGFLPAVSKLISLLKSDVNSSQKITGLESFLEKYKNSDLQPLEELVKEWKELEEQSKEPLQEGLFKKEYLYYVGGGVIVLFLLWLLCLGWKKINS